MTSTVLRVLLAAAYPFLILGSLQILAARWVAAVLGVLFLARWAIGWKGAVGERLRELWIPAALVGSVVLSTGLSNDERMLLLTPAVVNLALLVGFGRTLWAGPPLVETLARLQVPDLPDDEIVYCRSVTLVWCGFFALNSGISAWLAFAATRQTWAIYTGFLAYLLVGLLFACEFLVRSWRFGRYQGTIVEPLFRRIFPPPRGGTGP